MLPVCIALYLILKYVGLLQLSWEAINEEPLRALLLLESTPEQGRYGSLCAEGRGRMKVATSTGTSIALIQLATIAKYVCVCKCMCVYARACMYACVCVCVCVCVCTVYVYVYRVYIYTNVMICFKENLTFSKHF